MDPTARVGIAWYREDQWQLLRAVAPDSHGLGPTYSAWEKVASEQIWELENQGLAVQRVDVDLTELLPWCHIKGLTPDAAARNRFAQEKLALGANPAL